MASAPPIVKTRIIPEERGGWSCLLLLKRMFLVLGADKSNLLLLLAQPLLIGFLISFVVVITHSVPKKLFLGCIAVMWMACNNAAQVIVRERSIFYRERLAGLRLNSYVLSKFIGMGFIATVQALVLYAVLRWVPAIHVQVSGLPEQHVGLVGSWGWQVLAMTLSAWTLTGVGIAISAVSRTPTQAAFFVPLVIIPQILLAGFVFPLDEWKTRPTVALASWVCPSYAAQRICDVSLLWEQPIDGKYETPFNLHQSKKNIQVSLIPWEAWFFGRKPDPHADPPLEGVEYTVPASVLSQVLQPVPGKTITDTVVTWPDNPPFTRNYIFVYAAGTVQPLMVFLVWTLASYVVTLVVLSRGERA